MGVGVVANVVRDTGDRLELGAVVHELDGADVRRAGPSPREMKLEAQLREVLFASRPDLTAEQRAGLDKLDTDSLRVILAPPASTPPKPKRARPVDVKRRAEMREVDRQMGVGFVPHVIRDTGNRLELGAIAHESELDGVDVRRVGQPPRRQDAKGPAATAKLAPVDAKRLEQRRELARQMGVGFVADVVRDTGARIELGAFVHESELDGVDVRRVGQPKGRTPREVKLEAQIREVLFASRPDLGPAQRARLDELDTESLRVALVAIPSKAPRPPRSESSQVQAAIDKKVGRNLVTVVRDNGNRLELGAVVHRSEVGPGDLDVDKVRTIPKARATELVKAVGAAVLLGRLEADG
jgi:hypothetical protein